MDKRAIGKRIRMCREDRAWSQEALAEAVGISVTYVGMIERGEKVPRLETFVKIATALGVSADPLLADVLPTAAKAEMSAMSEKIHALSEDERSRIYEVVETMLRHKRR